VFIGHFAVGIASKRVAPQVSLGVLLLAPLFLDVLWPIFLVVGIETVRIDPGNTAFTPLDLQDYPYSHSLVMAIVWSLLFGATWLALKRDRRGAAVLALAVFSHWVLDWVTHRPDMPLWPGSSTSVGLGLWNSVIGTILVEGAMFVAAVASYTMTTRARTRAGTIGWWALVALLVILYFATAFGPPPPSVVAIEVMAIGAAVMFLWWATWLDRRRVPV
jgi:membrane-bound metal-dependent hydrolase YbcI (DUF457 family)